MTNPGSRNTRIELMERVESIDALGGVSATLVPGRIIWGSKMSTRPTIGILAQSPVTMDEQRYSCNYDAAVTADHWCRIAGVDGKITGVEVIDSPLPRSEIRVTIKQGAKP